MKSKRKSQQIWTLEYKLSTRNGKVLFAERSLTALHHAGVMLTDNVNAAAQFLSRQAAIKALLTLPESEHAKFRPVMNFIGNGRVTVWQRIKRWWTK